MDTENVDWVMRELSIAAERAKEEGVSPTEFLAGLVAYTKSFSEDYSETPDDPLDTSSTEQ